MKGVERRHRADGSVTYRARIRRAGKTLAASFDSPEEAAAWHAASLAALARGEAPEVPQPPAQEPPRVLATVLDAAQQLARGMKDGTVRSKAGTTYKPSVVRKYEASLRREVVPRIGAVEITALTRGDVQRLVDAIAHQATPEHARKALTALRVALRPYVADNVLDADPCSAVRVPQNPGSERPARVLSPEDVARLIAAATEEDARLRTSLGGPLFALLAGSGLRLGEALGLPWGPEGLDLDHATVHVRRSLDRALDEDGQIQFVQPKTRASQRSVPLAPSDVATLRRHRMASGRPVDGELVFTSGGDPICASSLPSRRFRRACELAGVAEPLPRLHDLRHFWATTALAAGLSFHAVAKLGGWSDASMVSRRYGHAMDDEVASAGEALERFRAARGVG